MADADSSNSDPPDSKSGTATLPAPPKPKPGVRPRVDKLPPFNVVLLNDDDHSYEYVIEMLAELFAHPVEKAFQMAKTVDRDGRVIVLTTHKERAELKRDQIHAYGTDERVASCTGSMSAVIEPAEGGGSV